MNTDSEGSLEQKIDLLLDGDLSPAELDELRDALARDVELRGRVRDDLTLSDALTRLGPSGLGRASVYELRWRRRATAAAAAVVLLLTGALGGMLLRDKRGQAAPEEAAEVVPIAAVGALLSAEDEFLEADLGGARVRVLPRGRVRVARTGRHPAVELIAGGLEVRTEDQAEVSVDGFGLARVAGSSQLVLARPASSVDAPYLLVSSWTGDVVLQEGAYEDRVPAGQPHVFDGGGPRLVGEVLRRLADLEGDEALTVLTSSESEELMSSLDRPREALQRRVGELLAENARLEMELGVRLRQDTARKTSLRELLELAAQKAEQEGLDGSHSERSWRRIRVVNTRFRRQHKEVLAAIKDILLADGKSLIRKRLGLWYLSRVRHPDAIAQLEPYAADPNVEVRLAAVEGLARHKSLRCRSTLQRVFDDDPSILVKTSAAGGLVNLGDYGAPFRWLQAQYERDPRHPDGLRRRLLGRILSAPVTVGSGYVLQLCRRPGVSVAVQKDVVNLLARIGTEDSRATLDLVAQKASRMRIRALARRMLERLAKRAK